MKIWRIALGMAFVAALGANAQSPPPPTPPAQAPQTPGAQPQTPAPAATPPATPSSTVVIDPGHGGTDAGARGATGILEKDVVMSLAQILRAALERQGLRVVLTRSGNDNPSYDDRAATANVYQHAVVITLHASSTGTPGTSRAYFFSTSTTSVAVDGVKTEKQAAAQSRPGGLIRWEEAQQSFRPASKRLADVVQWHIKQRMEKSPAQAAPATLRDLRSVAAPAIAVELASVSVKDRKALDAHLGSLADAIAKGVLAFIGTAPAAGGN